MISLMSFTSVEEVHDEAAQLERDHAAHKKDVAKLISEFHPSLAAKNANEIFDAEFSEADAKLVTARHYGFRTWKHLEVFLVSCTGGEKSRQQASPDFTLISCINYQCSADTDLERARRMLELNPAIAKKDIYHACCIGDVEAVRSFVEENPSLVIEPGGYFGWEPLMYACYSRLNLQDKSTLETARLLLQKGADPNAYYMWSGHYRFTALCGVFAEGEEGPVNFPQHPECEAFARLLLKAGANPNDGQSLYNRMFRPSSLCLKLLLEFGLGPEHQNNWFIIDNGSVKPETTQTLRYQLEYAIKSGYSDRAKLLIDHGASLTTNVGQDSLYKKAMLVGDAEIAEYLIEHSAEREELDVDSQFRSACMSGDVSKAKLLLSNHPDLNQRRDKFFAALIDDAASSRKYEAIRIVVNLGADLNRFGTPLCSATWSNDLEMVKLLIDLGADPRIRDNCHNATPVQWANHRGGVEEILTYLGTCDIDIFDAIICNNTDRIALMLDADPSLLEKTLDEVRNEPPTSSESQTQTPLVWAVLLKKPDVVRLLLERGANKNPKSAYLNPHYS